MIRIAIVDDDMVMLKSVQECIESLNELPDEVEIDLFLKSDEVLDASKKHNKYDILVSDIEMSPMNGIELGKLIKEKNSDTILIYLTSYEIYALKSYYVSAYQFVLKNEMDNRLPKILRECIIKKYDERKQYRIIKNGNEIRKLFYKDIIYLKKIKCAKYVKFYTLVEEIKERTTIEKVLYDLNAKQFIMVERGYVINAMHIERMSGNIIFMDNGDEVVISQARISEVKSKIHLYWEGV